MEAVTLEPWRRYGQPQILEKSQALFTEGIQSMHVKSNEVTGRSGFQQLGIPVEAGKTYAFSFDYFILEGYFKTWFGIKTSNGAFDGRVDRLVIPGSWQQYSREFTVPLDFTNDFRLMFNTQDSELYIDNIQITEIIVPEPEIEEPENPPEEEETEEQPEEQEEQPDQEQNPEEPPVEEVPQEEPIEENEDLIPEPEEEIEENIDVPSPSQGGNSTPEHLREIPPLDFDAINFPTNTVVINNGETETATKTLTLHFRIEGITEFVLSTNTSFTSSSFMAFATTTSWELPSGNGEKYFFVHFKTKQGYIVSVPQKIILNEIISNTESGGYIIPPQIEEIPNVQNCPFFQRRAYRIENGKEFYITSNCTKREFKNNYVFNTYRSHLRPIHTTTLEKLNEVPDDTDYYFMPLGPQYRTRTGDLLKLPNDPKVYLIVENKKYWIVSEQVFYHLGHNWDEVKTVDFEILDNLEEGGNIG